MTEPVRVAPAAAAERPCCGNCDFYSRRPQLDQKAAAALDRRGLGNRPGWCKRFPEAVLKEPDDICGEHPRLKGGAY